VDSLSERSWSADCASSDFKDILDWHLTRGTRAKGSPDAPGKQWTNDDFAHALGTHERTVRNWRRGTNVPTVSMANAIERELFGENPAYADWRTEVRQAHRLAKSREAATESGAAASKSAARKPFAKFKDIKAPWCPELVMLPEGEFLMGSLEGEEGRFDDERPQHPVTIARNFAMGRHPVTFDEYDFFCAATKRQKPKDEGWGRGRRPVINVSWEDAQAYVGWLSKETHASYRLPTEAEWEFACRAGSTAPFSFGDQISTGDANYSGSKIAQTTQVDTYPPNAWGLHDMHGNVWEWCSDAKREYSAQSVADPIGSMDVTAYRVSRGGSWSVGVRYLRSAFRHADAPGYRANDVGFRCARMIE
jgi:formylglycine-generating enzyme required for sulfatase activity